MRAEHFWVQHGKEGAEEKTKHNVQHALKIKYCCSYSLCSVLKEERHLDHSLNSGHTPVIIFLCIYVSFQERRIVWKLKKSLQRFAKISGLDSHESTSFVQPLMKNTLNTKQNKKKLKIPSRKHIVQLSKNKKWGIKHPTSLLDEAPLVLCCKTTSIPQRFLLIPKFQSFPVALKPFSMWNHPGEGCPCRKLGSSLSQLLCRRSVSAVKTNQGWSHVPTGILPSVPVFAGLFPFPAHTNQIPPPAPGALQKGSCAWGNVPGTRGTCICSQL